MWGVLIQTAQKTRRKQGFRAGQEEESAMEGQRVAKKEGGGKLPWVITGLVSGTALAGYLGLCAWVGGQQTIFPNVSVLGIDLSGMTAEQAGSTLAQTMAQEGGQVKVTLRYQDWSGELTAAVVPCRRG